MKSQQQLKLVKNNHMERTEKIEDYGFDRNDWAHFHDVILDVTWDNGKLDLNQAQMEELFWELPQEMREEARRWGMNDTPWRDSLWVWYQKNKMQ